MKIMYGSDDDPVFQGQAALGELMASVQQDNFQIEVSDIQTTGDTVTFAYSGLGDGIRELGVGPEVGTAEAVVQDGLIQSLIYTVDPAWVAAATPEPLPDVSLETLLGVWNQFDDEAGGENWFLFHEDGTYQGKHGPSPETGVLVTEGTFTLEGNIITFVDPTDCPEGESYESRFITSERIRFDPIGSTCELLPVKPIWKKDIAES